MPLPRRVLVACCTDPQPRADSATRCGLLNGKPTRLRCHADVVISADSTTCTSRRIVGLYTLTKQAEGRRSFSKGTAGGGRDRLALASGVPAPRYPTTGVAGCGAPEIPPTEIGSGFHEPQYPVRTSSCRLNLRRIHRTVSKVMTPIDKKSTTGPNIIDHKVELPTIKACPTVFQLLECTLSQIGNPISQRTEIATPIFCQPFIAASQYAGATRTMMITAPAINDPIAVRSLPGRPCLWRCAVEKPNHRHRRLLGNGLRIKMFSALELFNASQVVSL
jgi:hypothetical protein